MKEVKPIEVTDDALVKNSNGLISINNHQNADISTEIFEESVTSIENNIEETAMNGTGLNSKLESIVNSCNKNEIDEKLEEELLDESEDLNFSNDQIDVSVTNNSNNLDEKITKVNGIENVETNSLNKDKSDEEKDGVDDLDTLLSKINDLVEDCEQTKENNDEQREDLPDNDLISDCEKISDTSAPDLLSKDDDLLDDVSIDEDKFSENGNKDSDGLKKSNGLEHDDLDDVSLAGSLDLIERFYKSDSLDDISIDDNLNDFEVNSKKLSQESEYNKSIQKEKEDVILDDSDCFVDEENNDSVNSDKLNDTSNSASHISPKKKEEKTKDIDQLESCKNLEIETSSNNLENLNNSIPILEKDDKAKSPASPKGVQIIKSDDVICLDSPKSKMSDSNIIENDESIDLNKTSDDTCDDIICLDSPNRKSHNSGLYSKNEKFGEKCGEVNTSIDVEDDDVFIVTSDDDLNSTKDNNINNSSIQSQRNDVDVDDDDDDDVLCIDDNISPTSRRENIFKEYHGNKKIFERLDKTPGGVISISVDEDDNKAEETELELINNAKHDNKGEETEQELITNAEHENMAEETEREPIKNTKDDNIAEETETEPIKNTEDHNKAEEIGLVPIKNANADHKVEENELEPVNSKDEFKMDKSKSVESTNNDHIKKLSENISIQNDILNNTADKLVLREINTESLEISTKNSIKNYKVEESKVEPCVKLNEKVIEKISSTDKHDQMDLDINNDHINKLTKNIAKDCDKINDSTDSSMSEEIVDNLNFLEESKTKNIQTVSADGSEDDVVILKNTNFEESANDVEQLIDKMSKGDLKNQELAINISINSVQVESNDNKLNDDQNNTETIDKFLSQYNAKEVKLFDGAEAKENVSESPISLKDPSENGPIISLDVDKVPDAEEGGTEIEIEKIETAKNAIDIQSTEDSSKNVVEPKSTCSINQKVADIDNHKSKLTMDDLNVEKGESQIENVVTEALVELIKPPKNAELTNMSSSEMEQSIDNLGKETETVSHIDESITVPNQDSLSDDSKKYSKETQKCQTTFETTSVVNKDEHKSKPLDSIVADNSDNACDKFEDTAVTTLPESQEIISDSSSSNLLKETSKPPQFDTKDVDDDIEVMGQPPAKRICLSQTASKFATEQISILMENDVTILNESLGETARDGKSMFKRLLEGTEVSDDNLNIRRKKLRMGNVSDDLKKELKDISDDKPNGHHNIAKKMDINFEFLQRFKKSFTKMTKSDLEQLILQKVVEAIVHKSDISELTKLIDKQEQVILAHNKQIGELTKQFRDLEMVHSRVVKDLEAKNSQYVMPVRITRAVGLQVVIPRPKTDVSTHQGQNMVTQNIGSDRVQATTATPSTSTQSRNSPESNAIALPEASIKVRTRGCTQKTRPMRTDTTTAPPPINRLPSNSVPVTVTQKLAPKVVQNLPTSVTLTSRAGSVTQSTANNALLQLANLEKTVNRSKCNEPTPSTMVGSRQVVMKKISTLAPPKLSPIVPVTEPPILLRRSDGHFVAVNTTATSGNAGNLTSPVSSLNIAKTSITPNISNQKTIIDLTDEDDQSTPPVRFLHNTTLPIKSGTHTIIGSPIISVPQQQIGTNRLTIINNKPKPNVVQKVISPQYNIIAQNPTPQFVQISPKTTVQQIGNSRIQLNNPQTFIVRQRHPAPLPKGPPFFNNPAWKKGPPRPTIRINNAASGIVISWTMDELHETIHANIATYQIYAYQETNSIPQTEQWRHVGDVKSMLLPMAVTLTQFEAGQRYFFAVRAVDMHNRCGPFSVPKTWT